jgi:RNA polymerase sigma factor (sigma-70 family)
MDDDDRMLLERVAERDRGAFEALYRRYAPRLFGFVHRVVRRAEQVEDVVHETLLVVWRDAARFDGRARVSSWILGIAYRCALKALTRDATRGARELRMPEPPERADLEPGAESRLAARERADAIRGALGDLSPEQRAVVELTFYQGCSYREIAAIQDCPVNTVKTRMFHARRRLRRLLPEHGVHDAGSI